MKCREKSLRPIIAGILSNKPILLKKRAPMIDINNVNRARQNLSHINFDDLRCRPDHNKSLTIRELEILHLASNGLTNPQMADILSISIHTVKSHFDHIFNKLGVGNRTMAVVWAAKHGWI